MNIREARKAVRDYTKLVEKERKAWTKRVKVHKKELLRLAEIYIKLKEKV